MKLTYSCVAASILLLQITHNFNTDCRIDESCCVVNVYMKEGIHYSTRAYSYTHIYTQKILYDTSHCFYRNWKMALSIFLSKLLMQGARPVSTLIDMSSTQPVPVLKI